MSSDVECWECMNVAESRSMLSNRANEKKCGGFELRSFEYGEGRFEG